MLSVVQSETERLLLHPVRPADRDAIARIWSSPIVTAHLGGVRERAAVRRSLREYHDPDATYDLWVVRERESDRIVGHCGLLLRKLDGEELVEIIYVFGSRHWGKGYATEAALAVLDYAWSLGLQSVVAFIDPANDPSKRVAKKLGFRHTRTVLQGEGRLEQIWEIDRPKRRRRRSSSRRAG